MAEIELKDLKNHHIENEKKLKLFLLPKDEADKKNAIIEIRDSNEGEKRVQELLGHSDFGFPKGALCKRKCDIRVRKRRGGRREWTAKRGLVEMGMCMGGDRP